MKQYILCIIILCVLSCTSDKNFIKYSKDYVGVGKILDSVKLPYIVRLNNGEKKLLVVGVSHTYDHNNPQIKIIRNEFQNLNPDVIINEGGKINKRFPNEKDAVASNGEVGLLKYLSDSYNKRLTNGDIKDSLEFDILLRKHSEDDLLLYYVMERLIIPQMSGAYGKKDINDLYKQIIQKWFIQENFPISENLKTFTGYQKLYKSKIGHNLELTLNPDIELFDYGYSGPKYTTIPNQCAPLIPRQSTPVC